MKFIQKLILSIKNYRYRKAILIASGAVVFLALLIFIYNISYIGKIFPHTFISGINFSGKTKAEAETILKEQIATKAKNEIRLSYKDEYWTLKAEDLDINYDAAKSAEKAWKVGREGGFGEIVKEQLKSIFTKNEEPLYFNYNQNRLNQAVVDLSNKVDVAEIDATIVIKDDLSLETKEEKEGQKLNFEKTKEDILACFGNLKLPEKVNLAVVTVKPKVRLGGTTEAMSEVKGILLNKITLKAEKKDYELTPRDFAAWLSFAATPKEKTTALKVDLKKAGQKEENREDQWVLAVGVNTLKVKNYLDGIGSEINQEPKDAKFEVRDGKVTTFQLSQTGYSLDADKAAADIAKAILEKDAIVVLPVKVTQPEVGSDSAQKMGIKELVGEGTTDFSGSPQNRRHNIEVGAKSFHGVILKPGEEFSTLKYLGKIDASSGYLPELVIKEDRTIPEYGGGLCQVSTTLFRTVMNTGLKITERQNHSYRVSYYEPPVGMDATIYDPAPDFKFVNDLDSAILIQSKISGNKITFQFYGTKDGRRFETTDPYVYDVVGSGTPIYTESPDLPSGEIKQIEKAHAGSKATFTYRVFNAAGKMTNEQKFDSYYTPWPARYLYGPGTQIPPAE